jgi:hypothetical protein
MPQSFLSKVAVSLAVLVVTAPASYFAKTALKAWGILDAPANYVGRAMSTHISPDALPWAVGSLLWLALFGATSWLLSRRFWEKPTIQAVPELPAPAEPQKSAFLRVKSRLGDVNIVAIGNVSDAHDFVVLNSEANARAHLEFNQHIQPQPQPQQPTAPQPAPGESRIEAFKRLWKRDNPD